MTEPYDFLEQALLEEKKRWEQWGRDYRAKAEARRIAEQERLDSLCTAEDRIAELRSALERIANCKLVGGNAERLWARKALENDDKIARRFQ